MTAVLLPPRRSAVTLHGKHLAAKCEVANVGARFSPSALDETFLLLRRSVWCTGRRQPIPAIPATILKSRRRTIASEMNAKNYWTSFRGVHNMHYGLSRVNVAPP